MKHFHEHWCATTNSAGATRGRKRSCIRPGWWSGHRAVERTGAKRRKPCEGMMLHQDGSRHGWLEGQAPLDLIVTMDDATSTIYSAFLVEEEGPPRLSWRCWKFSRRMGFPLALHGSRQPLFSHRQGRRGVDKDLPTQVGRALDRLGIEHIPAYSPEARGRSERMFGTLQDRLRRNSSMPASATSKTANRGSARSICRLHNARFAKPAALAEKAFVPSMPAVCARSCASRRARRTRQHRGVCAAQLQLPESPCEPITSRRR